MLILYYAFLQISLIFLAIVATAAASMRPYRPVVNYHQPMQQYPAHYQSKPTYSNDYVMITECQLSLEISCDNIITD